MAKILRMTCASSSLYTSTAQTAPVIKAMYKLFLSGVSDPAVYKADPVCGAYCTSINIILESYGDTDIYPTVDIDATNFTVTTPGYKLRVSMYKYSSLHYLIGLVPYISTATGYYNANAQPSYADGVRTTTFTGSPDPIHMLNPASLSSHPHTATAAVTLDVSVFFGTNTLVFGDNSAYVSKGSILKNVAGVFVGASFSNAYNQSTKADQSGYKLTVACLNPVPSTPDAATVGTISTNYGPLVSAAVNFTATVTLPMPTNFPPPVLTSDNTIKPIFQLRFWSPLTGDVDLSSEGVFLYTMANASEYALTVLNSGTTYRSIGGAFLVAS